MVLGLPSGGRHDAVASRLNTMGTVHRLPSAPKASTALEIRIELKWLKPSIWRRVRVPAHIALGKLHRVIQTAMGWTDSHLHEFLIGGRRYGIENPDWDMPFEIVDEAKVPLDTALKARKTFTYTYDFGDSWEHTLKVEKKLSGEVLIHPLCEAGKHACPPEDVGGPDGYVNFLHAVLDSHHPEHQAMLDWCGGSFDPYAFDIDQVNRQLKRIKL